MCTLSDETVFKRKLVNGAEISDDEAGELCEISDYETAKRDGASLLSRSAYTVRSFTEKLKFKGHSSDAAKKSAEFYIKNGFLDDEKYAMAYAKDALRLKNDGKTKIMYNLMKKGISRDIIDSVLSELEFDDALYRQAEKELKKIDTTDKKSMDKVKRRLFAKGFSLSEINRALNHWEETEREV